MSYRDPKQPKWLTRGSGCGCAVALLVGIGGFPWLFAKIWSCAHATVGSPPCGRFDGLAIGLGIIVVAGAAFSLVKWVFDRSES